MNNYRLKFIIFLNINFINHNLSKKVMKITKLNIFMLKVLRCMFIQKIENSKKVILKDF